ncbi:MAG: ParB/RepB/Spo0J family partition protein [Anaerolineae bacterium]
MAKKRAGLGKGLEALIPSQPSAQVRAEAVEIAIDHLRPNPHQPRQRIQPEQLQELADSIRQHGLIQPLVVTQAGAAYQIIAGERRWRAAQLAGLSSVPAIVKETSPQQMLELALVENVQRADLSPLEEAAAYAHLMEAFGLTQEAVAERVGKSRVAVANTVRLLKLPEDIQQALASEQISEGHARALLGLKDVQEQRRVLEAIVAGGLNVRQTEALVRQRLAVPPKPRSTPRQPLSHRDKAIQEKFRSRLGTRVDLTRSERGGKVVIHFYSDEELQAIFSAIAGEDSEL